MKHDRMHALPLNAQDTVHEADGGAVHVSASVSPMTALPPTRPPSGAVAAEALADDMESVQAAPARADAIRPTVAQIDALLRELVVAAEALEALRSALDRTKPKQYHHLPPLHLYPSLMRAHRCKLTRTPAFIAGQAHVGKRTRTHSRRAFSTDAPARTQTRAHMPTAAHTATMPRES